MIGAIEMSQWGYVIVGWIAVYVVILAWYIQSRPPAESAIPTLERPRQNDTNSNVTPVADEELEAGKQIPGE